MLRPYQEDAIKMFLGRPDKRIIFAHATSAGKTLTAIRCAQAIDAKRILVVCPAIGRPTWVREFQKWAPELNPHSILWGRTRKGLSKAKVAAREAAYTADVQIVSYNMIKELSVEERDLLILDELHALRAPLSKQSKLVRIFQAALPKLPIIGLTATPIPTEVRQLWCPLDTLWPGQWGRKHPAGDVSWEFQARYCHREENEYGVRYVGSKSPEALAELGTRLVPFIHRVTDKEVAQYLPPLHAEPLYLDEVRPEEDIAVEWAETAGANGATHLAVIAFNRETARRIASKLDTEYVVTGEKTAEARQIIIDQVTSRPRAILVATSEAVRESISLSFCSQALIFQWRTSPAQAIQLMGRFPRQDAADLTRPTFIQYAVFPDDETRAETLSLRIKDVQALMAADRKSEQLVEIFKPRELTESRLENMFNAMMGRVADTSWEEDE